jgi:hypothetical protein
LSNTALVAATLPKEPVVLVTQSEFPLCLRGLKDSLEGEVHGAVLHKEAQNDRCGQYVD